jgi:uncharacterized protein with NRDE domain
VVTNVRDPRDPQLGASRGLLATDFLAGDGGATAAHAQALLATAADYRPFNLLTFDAHAPRSTWATAPARAPRAVTPGVHGLSNADFNTPWPKTRAPDAAAHRLVARGRCGRLRAAVRRLADETRAPDAELPDTGVGLERERLLSPAFIRGERYGTRASTVVAIGHDGVGAIVERRFGPQGRFDGETRLTFGTATAATR